MIVIYILPQNQAVLTEALQDPQPKHIWHDVPKNRVIIYTGKDIPTDGEST